MDFFFVLKERGVVNNYLLSVQDLDELRKRVVQVSQ